MSLLGTRSRRQRLHVWCWLVLVWVSIGGTEGVALAAPAVLVMVRTIDHSDPTPYELRLRSEMASEGIAAVVVNPMSSPGDTKQLAAKFGANAVVEVTVSTAEVTTAIWTAEPSLGLEVTRNLRVSTRERDAVAVFALRTVDFLQGARIELEQQRQSKLALDNATSAGATGASPAPTSTSSPSTTTPPPNSHPVAKPSPTPSPTAGKGYRVAPPRTRPIPRKKPAPDASAQRLRIAVAYAVQKSSDEFRWSTAPGLAAAWHVHPRWSIGVVAIGPYINHIRSTSGQYSVTVDQELFALDVRYRVALAESFDLEPHLGPGFARYAANGTARAPLVGHHAKSWSLFTLGGCALVWRLGAHFRLLSDVFVFGRWEAPSVQVDNDIVTGSSRWNLVLSVGPSWTF